MRKQTGKIYVRDLSKSPDKFQPQNHPLEDQRTIRKQAVPKNNLRVPRNSKSNNQISNSQSSWHHTFSHETSRQFSSIHESSMVQDSISQSSSSLNTSYKSKNHDSFINYECGDSLAIYENPVSKNEEIVKKLTHLNNIFKEIKNLRLEKLNKGILQSINETQRDLIEVERQVLKNC